MERAAWPSRQRCFHGSDFAEIHVALESMGSIINQTQMQKTVDGNSALVEDYEKTMAAMRLWVEASVQREMEERRKKLMKQAEEMEMVRSAQQQRDMESAHIRMEKRRRLWLADTMKLKRRMEDGPPFFCEDCEMWLNGSEQWNNHTKTEYHINHVERTDSGASRGGA